MDKLTHLQTPLGEIQIRIDGEIMPYTAVPVEIEKVCNSLDGRYYICVMAEDDSKPHSIACEVAVPHECKAEIDGGECLYLLNFYHGGAKLSVGAEYDCGYDYECEYLPCGIEYRILPETKTRTFVFGAAWIEQCSEDNDIHTWFGADPTMMKTPRSKEMIDAYIARYKVCKVCTEALFRDHKAFLQVVYHNNCRIEAVLWYDYCRKSEQKNSLGSGGYTDWENPEYMWAETLLYDNELSDKTLEEMEEYIESVRAKYPGHDLYPSFFIK